jgi:TPR repeat protein
MNEAEKLHEQACEIYEAGELAESAALFKKAARMGQVNAQINLANMYDEGQGVAQDFARARYWYKKAARRGSPQAEYNLGITYLRRLNPRRGEYWLIRAAGKGDEMAAEVLANNLDWTK